jgi:hypothetical protein
MANFLASIALEAGKVSFTTALVLLVLWLARNLIQVRLKSSVQSEFDHKLERIRSELRVSEESLKAIVRAKEAEIDSLRDNAMTALATRRVAFEKRRMEACDHIWEQVSHLQPFHGLVTIVTAIYTEESIRKARNEEEFRQKVRQLTSAFKDDDFDKVKGMSAQPYMSDLAWALFDAYKTVVAFAIIQRHILANGLDGSVLMDHQLSRLLIAALPEKEDEIRAAGNLAGAQFLDHLVNSLLVELKRILDGKADDEAAIAHAAELVRRSRDAQLAIQQANEID